MEACQRIPKVMKLFMEEEIDMPITPMKDVDVYTGQVAIRG